MASQPQRVALPSWSGQPPPPLPPPTTRRLPICSNRSVIFGFAPFVGKNRLHLLRASRVISSRGATLLPNQTRRLSVPSVSLPSALPYQRYHHHHYRRHERHRRRRRRRRRWGHRRQGTMPRGLLRAADCCCPLLLVRSRQSGRRFGSGAVETSPVLAVMAVMVVMAVAAVVVVRRTPVSAVAAATAVFEGSLEPSRRHFWDRSRSPCGI